MPVKFDLEHLSVQLSPLSVRSNSIPAGISFVINSIDDKFAAIVQAPYDITISHLGWTVSTFAGTPVQHKISLQGITTGGVPDGNIKGGGNAYGTFTPPPDTSANQVWKWASLTSSYSATAGEFLCIVVEPVGTPDGSNNSTFSIRHSVFAHSGFPYTLTQTNGGAWTKLTSNPLWGIKNSDASLVGGFPMPATGAGSRSTNTSGNRLAVKFTVPAIWDNLKVIGIKLITGYTGGQTFRYGIWTDSSTIASIDVDSDFHGDTNPNNIYEIYFDDDPAILSSGVTYYAGIECVSSSSVILNTSVFTSNDDMEALPGGKTWVLSSYTAASSTWADTNTERPYVDLILHDIGRFINPTEPIVLHNNIVETSINAQKFLGSPISIDIKSETSILQTYIAVANTNLQDIAEVETIATLFGGGDILEANAVSFGICEIKSEALITLGMSCGIEQIAEANGISTYILSGNIGIDNKLEISVASNKIFSAIIAMDNIINVNSFNNVIYESRTSIDFVSDIFVSAHYLFTTSISMNSVCELKTTLGYLLSSNIGIENISENRFTDNLIVSANLGIDNINENSVITKLTASSNISINNIIEINITPNITISTNTIISNIGETSNFGGILFDVDSDIENIGELRTISGLVIDQNIIISGNIESTLNTQLTASGIIKIDCINEVSVRTFNIIDVSAYIDGLCETDFILFYLTTDNVVNFTFDIFQTWSAETEPGTNCSLIWVI